MPTRTEKKKSTDAKPSKLTNKLTTKSKPGTPAVKKLSALDAAFRVLSESKEPMTTGAMIQTMAAKGFWTSPGGKTPAATLYSAIAREITERGKEARFVKAGRGLFKPSRRQ